MPSDNLIGLSAFVAIAAAVGTVVGFLLKELLFPWALDVLKDRRVLQQVFRRYRDPILLSAGELVDRLDEVIREYPPEFLAPELLADAGRERSYSSVRDPAFMRYKCQSTLYRLCAFLAWLELYRQDVVFLRSGERSIDEHLGTTLKRIRSILADGNLNVATDWASWKDALVLREEQRAIGEEMIVVGTGAREVMSYGRFVARYSAPGGPGEWLSAAGHFLFALQKNQDFRLWRLQNLAWALIDLIELLSSRPLSKRHEDFRSRLQKLPLHSPTLWE